MGRTPQSRRILSLVIIPIAMAACAFGLLLRSGNTVHAGQEAAPGARTITLPSASAGKLYALSVAVKDLAKMQANDAVRVTVNDAQGEVASKWLHSGRSRLLSDLTAACGRADHGEPFSPRMAARLRRSAPRWQDSAGLGRLRAVAADLKRGVIAAAPNGTWQQAQPFELGQTIFGSDDERPYAPIEERRRLCGDAQRIPVVPLHLS